MPVILDASDYAPWLDPSIIKRESIEAMIGQFPAEQLRAWRVDPNYINRSIDDERCLAPPATLPEDAIASDGHRLSGSIQHGLFD